MRLVSDHIRNKKPKTLLSLANCLETRADNYAVFVRWPALEESLRREAAQIRQELQKLEDKGKK